MRLTPPCGLALLLLIGSLDASAQSPPRARETRLVFDWPDGAEAEVVATRSLQNRLRGSAIRSEARFAFVVSRTRGMTAITSRDFSIAPIRERLVDDAVNASLVATMLLPSMTFTSRGGVAELTDAGAARRTIEAAVERAVPSAARAAPSWQLAASTWSSTPALERMAASSVEMMLASLASRSLVPGRSMEFAGASSLVVSGMRVPQRGTIRLNRMLPCFEGDAANSCVEIAVQSVPEQAVLARIAEAAGMRSLEMTSHALIVTEPRTLLPHRCEVRTRRAYSVEIGGAVRNVEEIEVRTWAFAYRRETIRRPARP